MAFVKGCNLKDLGMFEGMLNEMGVVLANRAHENAVLLETIVKDEALNTKSITMAKNVLKDEAAANMFKGLADEVYGIGCDLYY